MFLKPEREGGPLNDRLRVDELITKGTQLFKAKRFQEAEAYFFQALLQEPYHSGAAHLLSLAFYFSGSFAQALHLFNQLIAPDSPLEPKQIEEIEELNGYARLELLRKDYWNGLKLKRLVDIELELNKRGWDTSSLEAFHLYLSNGLASNWLNEHSLGEANVLVRMTSRNDRILLLRDCVDADMSIGSHLEAVRGSEYVLIPFGEIRCVEMGPLKRWIRASLQYRDGSWVEMRVPLMYRDSMLDDAPGIKEGVETVLRPFGGIPNWKQAFGQKQYKSSSGMTVGLAEVAILEIETTDSLGNKKAAKSRLNVL